MGSDRIPMDRGVRVSLALIAVAATFWLLKETKDLLIPVAVALLIGWLIDAVSDAIEETRIGSWSPPNWLALVLSLSLVVAILCATGLMFLQNAEQITEALPSYEKNLDELIVKGAAAIGVKEAIDFTVLFESVNLTSLVTNVAQAITGLIGNALLIFIYVAFVLIEERTFRSKITAFFSDREREESARQVLNTISAQVQSYLRVKTVMSVLTGVVSYVILASFSVDFAVFWAFIIFLMNYIPIIGSIIGALLPAILALVQFGDPVKALIILSLLGFFAQFVIGNFIEPRFIGESLNLSPMVVLLSLAVWGYIWGVAGMFLSVPITVIIMIISCHFEHLRPVAVLLSNDGKIMATQK